MRFWFQGGWKKKSVAVLLENLHLKKSSDHERLSGRDLAPCTPASLAEKRVLPVWAVEGGHCVGVQYMLWSQSHYQSTHLNLIFFFFFLALFYDNKGCTRSRSHVSEPLFCLCFFCAAAFISFSQRAVSLLHAQQESRSHGERAKNGSASEREVIATEFGSRVKNYEALTWNLVRLQVMIVLFVNLDYRFIVCAANGLIIPQEGQRVGCRPGPLFVVYRNIYAMQILTEPWIWICEVGGVVSKLKWCVKPLFFFFYHFSWYSALKIAYPLRKKLQVIKLQQKTAVTQ